MRRELCIGCAALALVAIVGSATTARAHELVDEGRQLYETADFEAALATLARAEEARDLTLADLRELYMLRALVHLGLEDRDAFEGDLARLLSIDPDVALPDTLPPEVAEARPRVLERNGGAIRVAGRVEANATGVLVHAEVAHDPAGVTRGLRVHGRAAGGETRSTEDPPLSLPAIEGRVEYWAEALGPGGVIVAGLGSSEEPRVHRLDAVTTSVPEESSGGPGAGLWIGLGVGAAAVVGAVVAIVIVTSGGSSDGTQPTLPMILE